MRRSRSVPKIIQLSYLWVVVIIILTACSRGPEAEFKTYQSRLASLVNETPASPEFPPMPLQPSTSVMRQPVAEVTIGLVDSMRFDRCRLGAIIAERNSSLGRVRNPAQVAYYELSLLPAIAECLNSELAEDERLARIMQEAYEQKRADLPAIIHNFLTTDQVLRDSFRGGRRVLSADSTDFTASLNALNYLIRTFHHAIDDPLTAQLDLSQWHNHMRVLGQSDAFASHWRAQQRLIGWLAEWNRLLAQAPEAINCRANHTPIEANYMHNLMHERFAQNIQPHLARWNEQHRQLEEVLHPLQNLTLEEEWHRYLAALIGDKSHGNQVRNLTRQHAELWQAFLTSCGFDSINNASTTDRL
ncbi:MAG: DUF3080 family protein [Idiomarina sp.]|nr:DUF3080 family protein [Idiomarina sp.]